MVNENKPMHYKGNCEYVPRIFHSTEEISQLIEWDITSPKLRPSRVRMLERAIFTNLTN